MNPENLLANLANPQPDVRLSVTRVLGMVEETSALKAIGEQYKIETDPAVKQALAWAGQRLYAALKSGHNTTDTIFEYFNINKEIQASITEDSSETEAELLKKMEDELQLEMFRRQKSAGQAQASRAAAAGVAGAMLGGGGVGASMVMDAMQKDAETFQILRPQTGKTRTPATQPADTNIDIWIKRLLQSADDNTRLKAARELQIFNNLAALPHLATVFITDPSERVREAALTTGKDLYLNAVYWQMEQSGALAQEIDRRTAALTAASPTPAPEQQSNPPSPPTPAPEQQPNPPSPPTPAPEQQPNPPSPPTPAPIESRQSDLKALLRKSRARRKKQQG